MTVHKLTSARHVFVTGRSYGRVNYTPGVELRCLWGCGKYFLPKYRRFKMTEFVMECCDEELEPWQTGTGVIEIYHDDDDPIFVKEIICLDIDDNTGPTPALKCARRKLPQPGAAKRVVRVSRTLSAEAPSRAQPDSRCTFVPIVPEPGPRSITKTTSVRVTSEPLNKPEQRSVGTDAQNESPQPVLMNNQLRPALVPVKSSPGLGNLQLWTVCSSNAPYLFKKVSNEPRLLAPHTTQYPAGTSFTVLSAGHPVLQQLTAVKLIQGNAITLSSAQNTLQPNQPVVQLINVIPQPAAQSNPAMTPLTAQSSPSTPQASAQSSLTIEQPAVQSSHAIPQPVVQSSPVTLQQTAHLSLVTVQQTVQHNSTNCLRKPYRSSCAIQKLTAQPSGFTQKWVVEPVPASPQSKQTGSPKLQIKLISPPKQQATLGGVCKQPTPTAPVTREETCSPGDSAINPAERDSEPDGINSNSKRQKLDTGPPVDCSLKWKIFKGSCPNCNAQFSLVRLLISHMEHCCSDTIGASPKKLTQKPCKPAPQGNIEGRSKLVMVVSDLYYGNHVGDQKATEKPKTEVTFKCNSCSKVLENNIRFMDHMMHHLQSNKSWDHHKTCQNCYRQYSSPLQLQHHVKDAHTHSPTSCKICELGFRSEQIFLEHMRDAHKPGEMPYVCEVCNYRSSFFSEVENHFRSEHKGTKDLLCPFCLKVMESGQMYVTHCTKHQERGTHECVNCRLVFLTLMERVVHETLFHQTFKKPKILKGLPSGTEVLICASSPATSDSSAAIPTSSPHRATTGTLRSPQHPEQGPLSPLERKALWNISNHLGEQTCMECSTKISDFCDHYPAVMNCSECKYRTSCIKSLQNHKIWLHGAMPREGFRKKSMKSQGTLRGITLKCLNCDFPVDPSDTNLMTKHLIDRQHHTCRVVVEKEPVQIKSEPDVFIGADAGYSKNESGNPTANRNLNRILTEYRDETLTNAARSSVGTFRHQDPETWKGRMEIKEEQAW
ncbi:hypothetical protein AAFF_G00014800 [Aldrovandia affinis]|uniref:C2H2-type domain-containing protein n=1 Tax=Aldrovandia affinis TaxID=143900 RepID=A0AAD7WGZ4_9TELE|nr:hypothetical protein AAFF_G00014800 [Aldrovandia affinis]